MTERAWTTKTLAKHLARFLQESDLTGQSTVNDLLDSIRTAIVFEETGSTLVMNPK